MKRILLAVPVVAALAPTPAFACAVCGCTLTSDWLSQGFATQPGTSFALRFDIGNQDKLYSGSHRISLSDVELPSDDEVELKTLSHTTTFTVDHQFANDFGINVQIPYVVRRHDHIEGGELDAEHLRTEGWGDLRAVARWTGLSKMGSLTGIEVGVVLPTGDFKSATVERGLTPGTGTVQLVAGVFQAGRLSSTLDYVVQVTGQVPLNGRDEFKPAKYAQASASLAYTGWRGITPQLQVNARATGREHGLEADGENSGGEQVLIAPGVTVPIGGGVSAFGFAELPLYTRVNGLQVVAPIKASFGVQISI